MNDKLKLTDMNGLDMPEQTLDDLVMQQHQEYQLYCEHAWHLSRTFNVNAAWMLGVMPYFEQIKEKVKAEKLAGVILCLYAADLRNAYDEECPIVFRGSATVEECTNPHARILKDIQWIR